MIRSELEFQNYNHLYHDDACVVSKIFPQLHVSFKVE